MNVELLKKEVESLRDTIQKKNKQIRKKNQIIDKFKSNQEGNKSLEKSADKKPSKSIKKSRDIASKQTTHRYVTIDENQRVKNKKGEKKSNKEWVS